ncbi:hypothetical protein SLE2022_286050 [Rubroshorea leprosula]
MDNIGDTFDLVPFAAFHGHGKWTGVYGAFLLACYDCNNEEFQSICKIGSGFSEAKLEELSASLHSRVIPKPEPSYVFGETLDPDVWFEPSEVCELWPWILIRAYITNFPVSFAFEETRHQRKLHHLSRLLICIKNQQHNGRLKNTFVYIVDT